MQEIVVSDEFKDFLNKENEPLKELAKEYDTYINNAKDKEIERLNNIINELEEYILNHYIVGHKIQNASLDDILKKLQELKGIDKE